MYYDIHINKFIIFYISENDLIHELGHLIIDSNSEHYKVEKPWEREKRHLIDNMINAIVDILVNRNLVVNYNMEEFYKNSVSKETLADRILRDIKENKKIDTNHGFSDYCYIYLKLHFYLNQEDKFKMSKKWRNCLKKLRQRLSYEFKLPIERFKMIEEQLSKIKDIKDFQDLKQIGNYISNVLLEMNLWSKEKVLNKLKELFCEL